MPLTAMYRFYEPQFTLIRVLLAQNTTDSREQAADLLKQLYDFTASIQNIRFQIDVLALQALLCDSQGEAHAASQRLCQAVELAEPGGFIRLFVDLGPRLADMLKRLQKQNIAVDYIENILAAYRGAEHRTVSDATGDDSASPHLSRTRPQPLAESLTHRELDVLDLLAQRWSNKEIAAKLFIAVTTVKGHLQNICGKLNVSKRREAVEKAKKMGIHSGRI
jgi:LuxR family maltose regulon positive regulatory protein